METVLVTGGAGFIASHIVNALVATGRYRVVVVDNLSRGSRDVIDSQVIFIQRDISDPRLAETFATFRPSVMIHHAAQSSVAGATANPLLDLQSNIAGSVHLFSLCVEYGVRRVVFASTAAVYGAPLSIPIEEGHPAIPLSFYGLSKRTGEQYLEQFSSLYGLGYTILRYANVYGPRQAESGEAGVIPKLIHRLLVEEPVQIEGDGQQSRDFVYVADVVRANLLAMEQEVNGVFNVSSGMSVTILDLLERLTSLTGQEPFVEYQDPRPGDIRHSCLSYEKARQAFGWEPLYSLRDGLVLTTDHYRAALRARTALPVLTAMPERLPETP